MSRFYSVADCAELVGQSVPTIREKIRTGQIFAYRAGNGPKAPLRIRSEELARYMVPIAAPTDESEDR